MRSGIAVVSRGEEEDDMGSPHMQQHGGSREKESPSSFEVSLRAAAGMESGNSSNTNEAARNNNSGGAEGGGESPIEITCMMGGSVSTEEPGGTGRTTMAAVTTLSAATATMTRSGNDAATPSPSPTPPPTSWSRVVTARMSPRITSPQSLTESHPSHAFGSPLSGPFHHELPHKTVSSSSSSPLYHHALPTKDVHLPQLQSHSHQPQSQMHQPQPQLHPHQPQSQLQMHQSQQQPPPLPTIRQGMAGPVTPLHSPMMYSESVVQGLGQVHAPPSSSSRGAGGGGDVKSSYASHPMRHPHHYPHPHNLNVLSNYSSGMGGNLNHNHSFGNNNTNINSSSGMYNLHNSPLSLSDTTDRTSPMSSPSLSPHRHMTPLQLPRSSQGLLLQSSQPSGSHEEEANGANDNGDEGVDDGWDLSTTGMESHDPQPREQQQQELQSPQGRNRLVPPSSPSNSSMSSTPKHASSLRDPNNTCVGGGSYNHGPPYPQSTPGPPPLFGHGPNPNGPNPNVSPHLLPRSYMGGAGGGRGMGGASIGGSMGGSPQQSPQFRPQPPPHLGQGPQYHHSPHQGPQYHANAAAAMHHHQGGPRHHHYRQESNKGSPHRGPSSSPRLHPHHSHSNSHGAHNSHNSHGAHHYHTHTPHHGSHHHHSSRTTPSSPPSSSTIHPPSSRSSTEILKTLLRKKACLYEPETSRAVSLVTWLVGRRLALTHGFFTRQQLQSGVHACVAAKIAGGKVTRTKVNRCMQIILNSCFHYIIPRPDGSEESGEAFRRVFGVEIGEASRTAAGMSVGGGGVTGVGLGREEDDGESLLEALPPPWAGLCIDSVDDAAGVASADCSNNNINNNISGGGGGEKLVAAGSTSDGEDEPPSSLGQHNSNNQVLLTRRKRSESWSHPTTATAVNQNYSSTNPNSGNSASGGGGGAKRAVLLCFNENVRCASDVFRCHDEFVRDVAHTARLNLGPEEWRSFFSGNKLGSGAGYGGGSVSGQHGGGQGQQHGGQQGYGYANHGQHGYTSHSQRRNNNGANVAAGGLNVGGNHKTRWRDGPGGAIGNTGNNNVGGDAGEGSPPRSSSSSVGGARSSSSSSAVAAVTTNPTSASHPSSIIGISGGFSFAHAVDSLDRMSPRALSQFRTSWCAKRYDHDPSLCAFAHVEINRGWLRRDPTLRPYRPILCPHVVPVRGLDDDCFFHSCPRGVECDLAHSREEIRYHFVNYKRRACDLYLQQHQQGQGQGFLSSCCPLRDVCPDLHTTGGGGGNHGASSLPSSPQSASINTHHYSQDQQPHGSPSRHHHHGRYHRHPTGPDSSPVLWGSPPHSNKKRGGGSGGSGNSSAVGSRHASTAAHLGVVRTNACHTHPPGGSPTMYLDPAPPSEFEKTLQLPGLRALFRDRCAGMYVRRCKLAWSSSTMSSSPTSLVGQADGDNDNDDDGSDGNGGHGDDESTTTTSTTTPSTVTIGLATTSMHRYTYGLFGYHLVPKKLDGGNDDEGADKADSTDNNDRVKTRSHRLSSVIGSGRKPLS